jgi:hypothetical protein
VARFKDDWLDANDQQALADWWCQVLGYRRKDDVDSRERRDPA